MTLVALHSGISRASPWTALAIFALALPLLYAAGLIGIGSINTWGKFLAIAIMVVGLDLVWGYTGMLSLCQALFFTLGGYAMGMYLAMNGPQVNGVPECISYVSSDVSGFSLPWFWQPFASFPLTFLLTLLVPGFVALVVGWFTFRSRVKGVYFSIITQALTIAVWLIFCRNEMRVGGTNGLTKWREFLGLDLWEPSAKLIMYLATVGALTASIVFAQWLVRTRAGRVLIAIRDSESRLRFAGYQPVHYKVFVFTIAAMLGGLGGALYTVQNTMINPAFMTAKESIIVVVMLALGGRGSIYGAVLGTLLYKFAEDRLTTLMANNWLFVLGGLFIAVVLFLPDGLVGAWRSFGRWLQSRARRTSDSTTAEAEVAPA